MDQHSHDIQKLQAEQKTLQTKHSERTAELNSMRAHNEAAIETLHNEVKDYIDVVLTRMRMDINDVRKHNRPWSIFDGFLACQVQQLERIEALQAQHGRDIEAMQRRFGH